LLGPSRIAVLLSCLRSRPEIPVFRLGRASGHASTYHARASPLRPLCPSALAVSRRCSLHLRLLRGGIHDVPTSRARRREVGRDRSGASLPLAAPTARCRWGRRRGTSRDSADSGDFSYIRVISSKWRAENRYDPASIVNGTFRAAA